MPLPSEQVYNDLNGEEVRQILATRFIDLLLTSPKLGALLRPNIVLPRVAMSVAVRLEVWGSGSFEVTDQVIIRTQDEPAPGEEPAIDEEELVVSTDPDDEQGQPPDQVREEHALPIPTPSPAFQRGPLEDAMELATPSDNRFMQPPYPDIRKSLAGPDPRPSGQRGFAKMITLDRGGPVTTGHTDYIDPAVETVLGKQQHRDHLPVAAVGQDEPALAPVLTPPPAHVAPATPAPAPSETPSAKTTAMQAGVVLPPVRKSPPPPPVAPPLPVSGTPGVGSGKATKPRKGK